MDQKIKFPSAESPQIRRRNFRYVQVDAIGVAIASAAGTFLPVFLARMEASSAQIALLTTMPAITGLFLALAVGQFLQTRRNVVPWFSLARLLVLSCYALTGLAPFIVPSEYVTVVVLAIWGWATLPQTIVAVAFSVVMNAVAGPEGRYELMTRRWSTLGLTSAITVWVAGQVADRIGFPLNYQVIFLGLSLGALVSYYFSSHLILPDVEPPAQLAGRHTARELLHNYIELLRGQPAFVSFVMKRLVFLTGVAFAAPLFPLYFVKDVQATNSWIGAFATVQTFVMMLGYSFWSAQSRRRGSRFVLLATTLGMSIYPALVGSTRQVVVIALFAGLAGAFQAGLDLVFFDELMKTVPLEYSATFVSLAQSLQHLAAIIAPLLGTALADQIGLSWALVVSAAIRLVGWGLFALGGARAARAAA